MWTMTVSSFFLKKIWKFKDDPKILFFIKICYNYANTPYQWISTLTAQQKGRGRNGLRKIWNIIWKSAEDGLNLTAYDKLFKLNATC